MTPAILLLAFVTLERLAELWLAARNTAALRNRGAIELAPGHYPAIVILHATWLLGLWILGWQRDLVLPFAIAFLALQGLRLWVLATLGRRWTTRIIVVPGETLVARGPYRFLRHPNYVVVIGEIALLPLALGLPLYALVFSILNAIILTIRIRAENRALASLRV